MPGQMRADWVAGWRGIRNDDTKRAYESSDDAYKVFRKMLASGHPPDAWDKLLKEATQENARLNSAATSVN